MSRIHEALKKAEEERAFTQSGENAKPRLVTAAGAEGSVGILQGAQMPSLHSLGDAPASSHRLGLDGLWERCAKPGWKLDPDTMVFHNRQSFARCAEQFRTLRSRLYQLRDKQPIRTLLVTSALPAEGKSFVALNLAQAIAHQHERRALLIDADLRASGLRIAMGAPAAPGLADYLRGATDEVSIIQADPSGQSNFFFIPAGEPVSNPAELVASARLKVLLDRLVPVFDWIILDAPPALPVSDASVLAGLCDGVIVVVRAESTAFDLAQTTCEEFRRNNLLGVVLNRAEEQATYGAYSYYAGNWMGER
jgi:protein-tyrosine kinase